MKLSTRLVLAMTALVVATAVSIGFWSYQSLKKVTRQNELERTRLRTVRIKSNLDYYLQSLRSDISVSQKHADIQGFVRASTNNNGIDSETGLTKNALKQAIVRLFRAEVAGKPEYLQYRLVGVANDGREIVRVDRSRQNSAVRTVPENQLQKKGQRDYFQNTLRLKPGQFHFSPIELNREHGKIEIPLSPVLRVATPIHGMDGRPFGILVINVDMRAIFSRLQKTSHDSAEFFIVNDRGDFVLHPQHQKEFGFEFGRPVRWQDDYPELANQPLGNTPVAMITRDRDGQQQFAGVSRIPLSDDHGITLVELVPVQEFSQTSDAVRNSVIAAGLVAILLAVGLAVVLARTLARPLEQLTDSVAEFTGEENVALPMSSSREVQNLTAAVQKMASEIRRRTDLLRMSTLDSAPIAAILVDRYGRITLANPMAAELFGYDAGELNDRSVEDLLPEQNKSTHEHLRQSYMEAPSRRLTGHGRELCGMRKDRTQFPVEIGLSPITTDEGVYTLAVISDVSERKAIEEERSRITEMLEQQVAVRTAELQNAVAALERSNTELQQFAYVASHDLQTPLRGISGFVQLLQRRYGGILNEEALGWIHKTVEATDRMRNLINDLLDYSRVNQRSQPFEDVSLPDLLNDVVSAEKSNIDAAGGQVTIGSLPIVKGDRSQLFRVFQNLIGNAIKYRSENCPNVVISSEQCTDEWLISVEDNGIGIDKRHQERIFEIFRRLHTESEIPGTGIGLAICRRVVSSHGGKLWVESVPGQGSVFRFTLPRSRNSDSSSGQSTD